MNLKPKTRTEQILTVMQILAWVAFIGYLIEGGAILLSSIISFFNPEAAKNLYKGMDLSNLRQFHFLFYTGAVSFMIVLSLMKSYVWYLVIRTLSKINLVNPFRMEVALKLQKISYVLFATWLVGTISSGFTGLIMKITGELAGGWETGEFIFMAGLIFIISQIFKRGVEIQSENELTV